MEGLKKAISRIAFTEFEAMFRAIGKTKPKNIQIHLRVFQKSLVDIQDWDDKVVIKRRHIL